MLEGAGPDRASPLCRVSMNVHAGVDAVTRGSGVRDIKQGVA